MSVHPEMQLGLLVGQYVLAREKFFQDPDAVCAWLLERERAQADATRWRVESVTFEDGEFVVTKINLAMEALTKVDLPGVPKAPARLPGLIHPGRHSARRPDPRRQGCRQWVGLGHICLASRRQGTYPRTATGMPELLPPAQGAHQSRTPNVSEQVDDLDRNLSVH